MKAIVLCEERKIEIDSVREFCVVVNKGLIIGLGTEGITIAITPDGLPMFTSTFNYSDFLQRLLT